jgi:excisionase family DNA binding protein
MPDKVPNRPIGVKRRSGRSARVGPNEGDIVAQRFLQLAEVSEILNISSAQAYALVRSGELPAIKIGGRGQWRVEATELENYIQRMYTETRSFVEAHPFGGVNDV